MRYFTEDRDAVEREVSATLESDYSATVRGKAQTFDGRTRCEYLVPTLLAPEAS